MDSDFIDRIQRMSLIAEEGDIIRVRLDNHAKILEECSLSLMGCFHTKRPINNRAAKNLLRSVWKFGSNLKITDVGEGIFQFKFSMEKPTELSLEKWSMELR